MYIVLKLQRAFYKVQFKRSKRKNPIIIIFFMLNQMNYSLLAHLFLHAMVLKIYFLFVHIQCACYFHCISYLETGFTALSALCILWRQNKRQYFTSLHIIYTSWFVCLSVFLLINVKTAEPIGSYFCGNSQNSWKSCIKYFYQRRNMIFYKLKNVCSASGENW